MSDSPWEIRFSASRSRPYFYNATTSQSVWETPSDLTEDQVLSLPGAHHLHPPTQVTKPAGGNGKVKASHLLIKHSQSRRPASWRSESITRSVEEATAILKAHQKELNQLSSQDLQKRFGELASTESDCSSAKQAGDLGYFGPKQMQKPFEDASFALDVGKMSDIVTTDSGVHLILRTA